MVPTNFSQRGYVECSFVCSYDVLTDSRVKHLSTSISNRCNLIFHFYTSAPNFARIQYNCFITLSKSVVYALIVVGKGRFCDTFCGIFAKDGEFLFVKDDENNQITSVCLSRKAWS